MDTGLGNRAYSIIGQGMISYIVDQKPEETRAMLEEAAGITKYKKKVIEFEEWKKEIDNRGDLKKIGFRCPVCGNVQTIEDFQNIGVDKSTIEGQFYFSCIGRHTGAKSMNEKPCNYTSGGLFTLNCLFVKDDDGKEIPVFDFAENPLCEVDE